MGKTRYYIIPENDEFWVFKKEGSQRSIKRDKHKHLLMLFAEDFCKDKETEILVCDTNGLLQDIINFSRKYDENYHNSE